MPESRKKKCAYVVKSKPVWLPSPGARGQERFYAMKDRGEEGKVTEKTKYHSEIGMIFWNDVAHPLGIKCDGKGKEDSLLLRPSHSRTLSKAWLGKTYCKVADRGLHEGGT